MLRRGKLQGSDGGSPSPLTLSPSVSTATNNQLTFVECESKVQELLTELHEVIKVTQKQREEGNINLEAIGKTQEKMQGEVKLSTYFKQKLRNLYSAALDDADSESDLLKKGLDIIAKIKAVQEEKRIAARLSSYNPLDDQPRKSMRRGVLMSMLQKSAQTLPLWIGKPNEKIPPLCGAVCAGPDYIAKPGDKVAARVKTDEPEEQWILAEVVTFNTYLQKYEVDDIDEEGREHHVLSKRRV
uniref:SGF29 C-terminal domain-containing protein n=1 Tax=Ciona savignyi TaxID=51511 RepID=H2Z4H0_CIOSA